MKLIVEKLCEINGYFEKGKISNLLLKGDPQKKTALKSYCLNARVTGYDIHNYVDAFVIHTCVQTYRHPRTRNGSVHMQQNGQLNVPW